MPVLGQEAFAGRKVTRVVVVEGSEIYDHKPFF